MYMYLQYNDAVQHELDNSDPTAHEEEPTNLHAGISIQELTMIYDKVLYIL